MTISDISRMRLAFVKETTAGQQVTGRKLQLARITSESLKQDTDFVTSREIRPDRQISAGARTRVAVSGTVDFEFSFGSFDEWLAAAFMCGDWSSEIGAASEVQMIVCNATATGGVYTLTYEGETTGEIAYTADAATIKTALEALGTVEVDDIAVSGQIFSAGTEGLILTFAKHLGNTSPVAIDVSGLTSVTSAIVTEVTRGREASEVQTIICDDTATGGTFTLTYEGETTAAIAFNANAGAIKTALELLTTVETDDIAVAGQLFSAGTDGLTLAFADTLGDVSLISIDISSLTSVTYADVTETVKGKLTGVATNDGIEAVADGNHLLGTDEDFTGYAAGSWVKISGFATAGNNGYAKIVSVTSSDPGVSDDDIMTLGLITLTDEVAGEAVTIRQGAQLTNGDGDIKDSFNFERTYTDLDTELAMFVRCMLSQMSLTVGTNALITGNVTVMGQRETSETVSGGTGYLAPNANEIMNSIEHVAGIYEDQTSIDLRDFNIAINNNLRERLRIGTMGPFDFGSDAINVSGTFTAYYDSSALYDKYLDFVSTSLAQIFEDTAWNAYIVDVPTIKVTEGARHAGAGMGDDFKVPCSWQAFCDPIENITIRIVRFAA